MSQTASAPALFISDLHLSGERPDILQRFRRFMSGQAPASRALYILGDLFEYWVGDDALGGEDDPVASEVVAALRAYTTTGRPLHVLHGNRDFLLSGGFLQATGAEFLPDATVVELAGQPTLLLHGDALCTDDLEYQRFKAQVRSSAWQNEFLGRALPERHAIMSGYRARSEQTKRGAPEEIMDVNPGAVSAAFERRGVRQMIHGHTHRHAHHTLVVGGKQCERWVLPDWYERGGYLSIGDRGPRLVMF